MCGCFSGESSGEPRGKRRRRRSKRSYQLSQVIMVVRIRLQRMGLRNLPFYRIVVADARAPRDGKFLEKVNIENYCN